jgi:hypothetical protein
MPIIGLTTTGAGSFPSIGELRKGGAKPNASRPGSDLTHFRFTSKHADVMDKFTQAFGNQPTSVDIYLPFHTAEENFDAWIEEWSASALQWRGDGETLVVWQKADGTYSTEPKPQPATGGKQVGRLKVIIPQLGRLAYVTALTTSIHDIKSMSETLAAYEALRGSLQGIPFTFSRVPREVSVPKTYPKGHAKQYQPTGERMRLEKWLWHLEAQPQWVMAQLGAMRMNALPNVRPMVALETGEIYEADDYEIVEHDDTARYGDGTAVKDDALEFYWLYQANLNAAPKTVDDLRSWYSDYKKQQAAPTPAQQPTLVDAPEPAPNNYTEA